MTEICDATYRGYTCGLLKGHAGNHRPQMEHKCHWPGCDLAVPPAMWGCKAHWFSIPKRLRDEIWRTYRRGQEVTKTPSDEYIEAAWAVQRWIESYQASQRGQARSTAQRQGKA